MKYGSMTPDGGTSKPNPETMPACKPLDGLQRQAGSEPKPPLGSHGGSNHGIHHPESRTGAKYL